jgi:flagellar basal body-associated protein FliL
MVIVDREILRSALIRLRNEAALAPVKEYLTTLRDRELVAMAGLEGNAIYRAQGAYRIAQEILKAIEDSRTVPEKQDSSVKTAGAF